MEIGRYDVAYHKTATQRNYKRMTMLLKTELGQSDIWKDGLNTLNYTLVEITYERFFTHVKVNVTMLQSEEELTSVKVT